MNKFLLLSVAIIVLSIIYFVFSGGYDRHQVSYFLGKNKSIKILNVNGDFDDGVYAEIAIGNDFSARIGGGSKTAFSSGKGLWVSVVNGIRPVLVSCDDKNALSWSEYVNFEKRNFFPDFIAEKIVSIDSFVVNKYAIAEAIEKLPYCPDYAKGSQLNINIRKCKVNGDGVMVDFNLAQSICNSGIIGGRPRISGSE